MKRFYFTNDNAENIMNDHLGNIRGARTKAQKYANENNETVIINDCETEDIVDFIYPDSFLTSDVVEETESTRKGKKMKTTIPNEIANEINAKYGENAQYILNDYEVSHCIERIERYSNT